MNELSDSQTALIVEQLYGEGFEWGLSSLNIDVTSLEEPCSFQEAMASPDAPKWLAACNEELQSICDLDVFKLVPRSTAGDRTVMDGKFVFKLKRDEMAPSSDGKFSLSSRGTQQSTASITMKRLCPLCEWKLLGP